MSKKVVTFGELMLRLQPYDYLRFIQADSFEATFGGGEANVAVSLVSSGLDAHYVTKLPSHAIGQMAVNSLRKYGVNTSDITRGGDRVGISNVKVLLGVVLSAFTTARILRLRKQAVRILIGMLSLRGLSGSISPVLLRLWAPMLLRSARMPARPRRLMALRFPVTELPW